MIGLLFIKDSDKEEVLKELKFWRKKENYYGEIHFSEMPGSFYGKWGGKAKVGRSWLKTYENGLSEKVFFTALIVDRHSPAYLKEKFRKEFHAYNRFTAMALKAGISWFLAPKNYDKIKIDFISDAKDRLTRPDEKIIDNFENYIPYRAVLDSFLSQKKWGNYPLVTLNLKLEDSADNDLLQFCDLLLGATQSALLGNTKRKTKKEFGKFIVSWYKDLLNPPWRQKYNLYKKFNIWAFPDEQGAPYTNIPFALKDDNQLTFQF